MSIQIPSIDIASIIQKMERRDLDETQAPDNPPIWGQMENVPFVRIQGQAAFWKENPVGLYEQRMDDLIASAYGQHLEILYLIVGQSRETAIFIGLVGKDAEIILRSSLSAAFPGIILADRCEHSLGRILNDAGMFTHRGRLTGIPTRKGSSSSGAGARQQSNQEQKHGEGSGYAQAGLQIERIIRGLAGEGWGLLVHGVPIGLTEIADQAYACLDLIAAAAAQTKRQVQQLNQTMTQVDPRTQSGSTESISGEIVNRKAEYAVMLLERNLQRFDEAKAVGMWDVEMHFFSPKAETLARAESLVRAVYSGSDSVPQPLRVVSCGKSASSAANFITRLTSTELSTLSQLPREEAPGYRISDYARFDTDPGEPVSGAVPIGDILDGNRKTGRAFSLPVSDLSKHGLVVGMTGSGKTTTILGLLDKLWNDGKGGAAFLVIESAKAEYRRLRGSSSPTNEGTGPIPDLRVYTLGDETVAPIRLNPFEFEISDADHRVHVQTHIDYLKSVFNAAFVLYAPMPYVLETCLHEIYTDLGWDLATGLNHRLPESDLPQASQKPIFPTLSDLYEKIDEVTERLGYDERIEMDVKAGLKARIGGLRLGSKGLMLDTRHSIPINDLLAHPTILELERMGSDDEKAFIIGLIMTRVYEYRRVQASYATKLPDFQHLIVIEEAHRLLKNVKTEVETEAANTRGQAVEVFTNMLAEIRAYGQGVLIAEQIPSKLAPDAVKNTNLKIIHRMVAADDRDLLARTTNMDDPQARYVGTLPAGRAVVYAEPADHPYLIEALNYKQVKLATQVTDRDVAQAMSRITHRPVYEPLPDYYKFLMPTPGQIDTSIFNLAVQISSKPEFRAAWAGLMLNLILDPANAGNSLDAVDKISQGAAGKMDPSKQNLLKKTLMLSMLTKTLEYRGKQFDWPFQTAENLRQSLAACLMAWIDRNMLEAEHNRLDFVTQYRAACQVPEGPYAGCMYCSTRCLLRQDVAMTTKDLSLKHEITQAINRDSGGDHVCAALNVICLDAVLRLAGDIANSEKGKIAMCILTQAVHTLKFGTMAQRRIVGYLAVSYPSTVQRPSY